MKNKKLLLWFLVIISVAALVWALGLPMVVERDDIRFGIGTTASANNYTFNTSGTTNLTVSLVTNASNFVNVSIEWRLAFNDSLGVANNTVMRTVTIQNTSVNQTSFFKTTFDTTVLPDGIYNVSVSIFNLSFDDGNSVQQTIHDGNATQLGIANVTVDNTKPNGTDVLSTLAVAGATGQSVNFTRFNVTGTAGNTPSNVTFNVTVREQLSGVKSVFFEFFNKGNGTRFNISASNADVGNNVVFGNRSGYYSTAYNISSLPGGTWEMRTYITDQAGNINITPPVTFGVNGQINVSINTTSSGRFYSASSGNQTFMISIANDTRLPVALTDSNTSSIRRIILVFDSLSGAVPGTSSVNISLMTGSGNVMNTSTERNNSFLQGSNIDHSSSRGIVNFTAGVNVSNLTEGRYQLRVYAEDRFGNFNYTENITIIVDKTNPTVSITCTPTSPVVGEAVSCSCTSTDGLAGIRTAGAFAGGGSSESTTASSVGSFTSSVCSAVDKSGNKGTATGTFSVVESSDDGGSGAGGSGGGSSSGSSGTFGQRSWTSLNAGEVAVVDVTDKSVGVTKVSFGVTVASYGGWVRVSKRDNAPLTAEAFAKKMYKVVEITTSTALKESDVNNRKIEFRVEKSWLQTNSLAAADVTLYRLVNNEWVALAATVGQDDGTYVHYSATTPGFSFFLIGEKGQGAAAPGEAGAAEGSSGAAPSEEGATEGSAMAKEGMSTATIVVIVLVVLAAAGAVWYFFGRKEE